MKGYVYVLSNPSMPGLVKIGRSINDPQARARDLFTTGVPTPFVIEFVLYSDACDVLEIETHERFSYHRKSGREFFEVESCDVIAWLMDRHLMESGSRHMVLSEMDAAAFQNLVDFSSLLKIPLYTLSGLLVEAIDKPESETHSAAAELKRALQKKYREMITGRAKAAELPANVVPIGGNV